MPDIADSEIVADEAKPTTAGCIGTVAIYVAVLASLGAVIALSAIWFADILISSPKPASFTISDREAMIELRKDVERVKAQQAAINPTDLPSPLSALDARLKQIEQKQQRIERVIMADPNKALELPLMRRDLEALEERQAVSNEATRRSVEQVYDLSKWLIGALAVGVLSLALNTLLRRKDHPPN
jgi:hypothetical protein